MLTLLELSEQLGDAALSCKYDGPQRKILRKSLLREYGGKIVSEAVVDNDALKLKRCPVTVNCSKET